MTKLQPGRLSRAARRRGSGDPRSDRDLGGPAVQRLPRRQPRIEHYCRRCAAVEKWANLERYALVSSLGTAHIGEDDGTTACGIDATGDRWWRRAA